MMPPELTTAVRYLLYGATAACAACVAIVGFAFYIAWRDTAATRKRAEKMIKKGAWWEERGL